MGKLALSDSFESAHDSRAKSYNLEFGLSRSDSMKSEGTSSGFASASDSICKIFLAAKIFASGSDAFDSEYASFPPFHIKCISAKPI